MPPEECLTSDDGLQEQADGLQEQAAGRRRLLKALIASGGAVAASTLLPSKWSEPMVEVGMLPVHAQATTVPIPTRIPPTPTPVRGAIYSCTALNAAGGASIGPTDTIRAFADVTHPVDPSGIELRRTITLNEPGHPLNGVVDIVTGLTNASGRFQPSDFDLNTISPAVSPGVDRLTLLWEFVDPADGTHTCENSIEIV